MKPALYALTAEQRARITALIASHPGTADLIAAINREADVGDALNVLGHDETNPFVNAAHDHHLLSEGTLEVDPTTLVSEGDDGAYVMAWLWVSNEDAGVNQEGEAE